MTRPATETELEDWVKEYTTVDGKQVYVGGHWKDGTAHGDTETINKDDKIVRWHIPVNDGIIRIKPGWTFTIEELGLNDTFTVAELYGYDEDNFNFEDGQVNTRQSTELMKDFFAPTAEYFYSQDLKDPSAVDFVAKEESLELHEVNDPGPKAWTSETKDLQYSDYILFTNTMPTKLEVEKEWTDSETVNHTGDEIAYKIYRIPYQIVENPDYDPEYNPATAPGDNPDEPLHPEWLSETKRVDYPVQEVKNGNEHNSTQSIGYVSTMEGFTGALSFNSDSTKSWKQTVKNLPTVGWYLHDGDSNRKRVLYEYYVTEESDIPGYKYLIEGGRIKNGENEGDYKYTIKNEPLSPTDRFTHIDIEKQWLDAEGNPETDPELHKDDSLVFEVTQKKYKAMAAISEGETTVNKVLYPITINLVDEGGHAGNPRETDTVIVYVPKGATFTMTPYYNYSGNVDEHVVCVNENDWFVAGTTTGVAPTTRTVTTPSAPSNTYYYPNYDNDGHLTFTINNVNEAKEVTLWLHAGNDRWVYIYDFNDHVNYLNKQEGQNEHPASQYHQWTCKLDCDKGGIIWDLDEVYDHIINKHDAYSLDTYPAVTTTHIYTMEIKPKVGGGYYTDMINGENAPGFSDGDKTTPWKGSIKNLPLYEFQNTEDGGTYIYTYEIVEKRIGTADVKLLDTPVELGEGENKIKYKYYSSSYYVSWPDDTLFDAANNDETNAHSDGIKFINRKLPTIKAMIHKVDKSNFNETNFIPLSGAEFKLIKYNLTNGSWNKDTAWGTQGESPFPEDDENPGVFSLGDLKEGYYKIVETHFPDGYIKSAEDPMFQVKMDSETGEMKAVLVYASNPNIGEEIASNSTEIVKIGLETVSDNTIWTFTFGNEPGAALPSACSSGTHLFYFIGCILTMLAGASLVMKRNLRSGD